MMMVTVMMMVHVYQAMDILFIHRVPAVEMSYLREACGLARWDGESNESMYERCDMSSQANGGNCGVVEWVKRN